MNNQYVRTSIFQNGQSTDDKPSPEKIKPVVKVSPTVKKSNLRKVSNMVFGNVDKAAITNSLLNDILIPTLRTTAMTVVTGLIMGKGISAAKNAWSSPWNNIPTSYGGYFQNQATTFTNSAINNIGKPKSSMYVDPLLFASREEAEAVLHHMQTLLMSQKFVSLGQLRELCGLTLSATDTTYGWFDLSGARVRLGGGGFLLELSNPVLLGR